ncbi:hypothetical protein BO99DRAFT_434453 [Aspergillus violaceofuscus CBS 115571]|uniref:Uncharacterized protein n=1 Tax=Aspergillus violaceofuscus (strain CBS 115571) TaxID=1450538 RepID=A0A2V5H974_ASPV1|nr:hypothetical protein BO99DRAFT_434453 [Aspergillus violaceofuscus CBS 115571]
MAIGGSVANWRQLFVFTGSGAGKIVLRTQTTSTHTKGTMSHGSNHSAFYPVTLTHGVRPTDAHAGEEEIRPVLHPLFPQSNPSLVYGRPPPAAALFNNLWQADWTYFGLPRESTTFPFHIGTERAAQVYRTLQSRLNLLDLLEVEVHREHMTEGFPGGLHALVEICGGREVLLMDPAPVEELQPWLGLIIEACFRLRGAVVLIHSLVGAHWSPERTRRVGQLQHRTYSALVARDAFRAADDDSDVSMADAD